MTDMNPPTTAAQTVTPLTDAAEFSATTWSKIVGEETHAVVYGDFARHLETDLSSALAQLRQAREDKEAFIEKFRVLEAAAISLQKKHEASEHFQSAAYQEGKATAYGMVLALTTTAPKEKP